MTAAESTTMRVADTLEVCAIPYMLVGSFSSNFYGIPRSTKDADFVLQLRGALGSDFAQRLGDEFEMDPQLSFETNTGTYRQILHHKNSPFKVELFFLSTDAHDQSRFSRRRAVKFFDRQFWLPSPEDVIITKLRWARNRDKDDVKDVMSVQRGKLDWKYIEEWCGRHGTLALMEKIRASVPEI